MDGARYSIYRIPPREGIQKAHACRVTGRATLIELYPTRYGTCFHPLRAGYFLIGWNGRVRPISFTKAAVVGRIDAPT